MTTLASSINTEFRGNFAAIQGRCYFANDFNPVKVWDGISSTTNDAGIDAPTVAPTTPSSGAGNVTLGDHLVRYRYYNSSSLYVSNPSTAITVTVASTTKNLTFTVGTHLTASSDAKVDQIIVEATTAGGTKYYRVGTVANTAAQSLSYNVSDAVLIQGDNVAALTGDFGHEPPPLFAIACSHRGRLFGAGSTTRTRTVGVTNGNATVTGTDFSLEWAGRRIKVGSDTVAYQIASVSSATSMTLTKVYAGSTNASVSASIFSSTPNRLYWSRELFPEGWKATEYARDVLSNRSDEFRGMTSYSGDLWIFGRHSAERLAFTNDPGTSEGQIIPVPGERGVHNQACLIEAEGVLYAWDRIGMYVCGQSPRHLSKPIDRTLTDYVDFEYSADFHGVYDPTDRVLMWFFTLYGDTEPHYAACLELDAGRWSLAYFQQAITASTVVPDSEGQVRAMLGDSNGYTWFFGIEGGFDGLPPSAPSVLTTTGTPTSTVITVTQTLPTSPDMAGCVVRNTANDETAVIQSNTVTTLTMVSPGFTTTPAAAATLYAGEIAFTYESKWFTLGGNTTRVVYLRIRLHPSSATGKCRVYIYKEWSSTPVVFTSMASDVFPDGVTVTNGASYIEIDLDGGDGDGVVMVPLPCDWAKHWKAQLVCDRPDGEIRLLDMAFTYEQAPDGAETD
jgi:hypothetical protein